MQVGFFLSVSDLIMRLCVRERQNDRREINVVKKKGLNFVEALTLLFIALRLCNVIDWPWIGILSPMWITFCLEFLLAVFIELKG